LAFGLARVDGPEQEKQQRRKDEDEHADSRFRQNKQLIAQLMEKSLTILDGSSIRPR
jgi:hypothetical protein